MTNFLRPYIYKFPLKRFPQHLCRFAGRVDIVQNWKEKIQDVISKCAIPLFPDLDITKIILILVLLPTRRELLNNQKNQRNLKPNINIISTVKTSWMIISNSSTQKLQIYYNSPIMNFLRSTIYKFPLKRVSQHLCRFASVDIVQKWNKKIQDVISTYVIPLFPDLDFY